MLAFLIALLPICFFRDLWFQSAKSNFAVAWVLRLVFQFDIFLEPPINFQDPIFSCDSSVYKRKVARLAD